jgi:DnaJ-domain-containing protein 1
MEMSMSLASVFVGPATILLDFEAPDTRGELAMIWVLAGVGALYLGFAVIRMLMVGYGAARLRRLRDVGIGLILVGGPLAVLGRAAPWEAATAIWVLPAATFLFDQRFFIPRLRSAVRQNGSLLRTRFLNIELESGTDRLDGIVIQGRFEGRRLSGLSQDELAVLMHETSADPDSAAIVTSIVLQFREHHRHSEGGTEAGTGSRGRRAGARGNRGSGRRRTAMSTEEAFSVLGVAPGAGDAEILAAHRKLMKMVHPDKGGSDYLASKINEARDLLISR